MQAMPELVHLVRYEDLILHPRAVLDSLLTFCELPEDSILFQYAERILAPVPARQPLALSTDIEPLFLETMQTLDYPAGRSV
jgi:hypothetical protein